MVDVLGCVDREIRLDTRRLRLHREVRDGIARIPDDAGVAIQRSVSPIATSVIVSPGWSWMSVVRSGAQSIPVAVLRRTGTVRNQASGRSATCRSVRAL